MYTIQICHLNWNITRAVALEVININSSIKLVTVIYENTFFSLRASLIFGIAYQTMLVMLTLLTSLKRACHTIRYDARCYFNVRSKADMSQLNLYTARNRQLKSGKQKN